MKYFGIIMILTGFISFGINQEQVSHLKDSKWIYTISKGYTDTLSIVDTTYIFYSVELNFRFYGTYNIRKDTLELIEIGEYEIKTDNYIPLEEVVKYYLVLRDDKLHYRRRFIRKDKEWVDTGFKFHNYSFTKVESLE